MKQLLEADPPLGAHVTFTPSTTGAGCATPPLKPWLSTALEAGSQQVYGQSFASQGLGGSIPFIAMLIQTYPESQFIVTGVLGPQSNAHGPNEFLHVPYVKGLTLVVARMIAAHQQHVSGSS
ncbi:hypothetical protein AGDE_05260 [Angomonas deanei]|nr:hypothetical protein AGDE_05260 [Angomonas deanei]|eukprot:EPY38669.1 hypothetical protein AGDE_05260 [Angomonas deanei]